MVIPEGPYPLLGRDLLTEIGSRIVFSEKSALVTDQDNRPVQVLTLQLHDEYRLFQNPPVGQDISVWLSRFPKAWAETGGMSLTAHRPSLLVELKPGATPVKLQILKMLAVPEQKLC